MEDEATTTTDINDAGVVMVTDREGANNQEGGNNKTDSRSANGKTSDAKAVPKEKKSTSTKETAVVDCHTSEAGEKL